MANKAYLGKITNSDEAEYFFEEKFIPVYWYCLLDLSTVENQEEELIRNFGTDEETGIIKLSKEQFLKNLKEQRKFIEQEYYGEFHTTLYDDFTTYLNDKIKDDEFLVIDIVEMAWLVNMETQLNQLKAILKTIDNLEDSRIINDTHSAYWDIGVAFLCVGYDCDYDDDFSDYSEFYKQCVEDE
jgi:hypothetical protein